MRKPKAKGEGIFPPGACWSHLSSPHPLPEFGRRPSCFSAVSEKGPRPLLCAFPLPCVPVVSPPTSRGAHDRAQAWRRISAVFDAGVCRIHSRTPRVPGACQTRFLARSRRGGPVTGPRTSLISRGRSRGGLCPQARGRRGPWLQRVLNCGAQIVGPGTTSKAVMAVLSMITVRLKQLSLSPSRCQEKESLDPCPHVYALFFGMNGGGPEGKQGRTCASASFPFGPCGLGEFWGDAEPGATTRREVA